MNKAMTDAVALVGAAFGFSASAGVVCKGGAGGAGGSGGGHHPLQARQEWRHHHSALGVRRGHWRRFGNIRGTAT